MKTTHFKSILECILTNVHTGDVKITNGKRVKRLGPQSAFCVSDSGRAVEASNVNHVPDAIAKLWLVGIE